MKGGVVSRIETGETIHQQIDRIVRGSTYEYIQRGCYGFVFKVTYAGYSGFVNHATGQPVNIFVLKVQSINMSMTPRDVRGDELEMDACGLPKETHPVRLEDITKEVTLQQQLYEIALRDYQIPPCPAILFYKGLAISELESFMAGKIIYTYNGTEIDPSYYDKFFAAIILMEYVPSTDILRVDDESQELKNKAFTMYCLALKCGVNQVDALPQNYLLGEDGNVTMIDFGQARVLGPSTLGLVKTAIEAAEGGGRKEYDRLLDRLTGLNGEKLEKWLFWRRTPRLVEIVPLRREVAQQCLTGLCVPASYVPDIKRVGQEIERQDQEKQAEERKEKEAAYELKRQAMLVEEKIEKRKRDREEEEPEKRAKPECTAKNRWCTMMGGKRKTRRKRLHKKTKHKAK